ncbi:MAG TPA: hypothetical protein VGM11_09030 [Acidobacteriaceae bacterium]
MTRSNSTGNLNRSASDSNRPARPTLTLVPRGDRKPPARRSPLALWHLLSLDAPSVATVWTLAIAHTLNLHLPWTCAAAMFLAVWMLYAADRLLDARALDINPLHSGPAPLDLEERHRFHHRHRGAFLVGIAFCACILTVLLRPIDPAAMRLYALLATLLGAWLLLIHVRPADSAHRLPKELAVGLFFPAAVFIPTVARLPQLQLDLLPIAALLAALCSLNCLFLYAWEHPGARTHAHWSTRWATDRLIPLTGSVAGLAILFSIIPELLPHSRLDHRATLLTLCIALSALLLLLLHASRRRLKPVPLRALADLVLLTPLIPAISLLH